MGNLLLCAPTPELTAPVSRIGGVPLAPPSFAWPGCALCSVPMRFLAQVRSEDALPELPGRLISIFMCHNEDCAEGGRPDSGANQVLSFPLQGLAPLAAPGDVPSAFAACDGLAVRPFEGAYEDARLNLQPGEFVWGHAGGEAESVSRFVPTCEAAGAPMRFVVQLEQGHTLDTAFEFNGTTGCAFLCTSCGDHGTFFVDDTFY